MARAHNIYIIKQPSFEGFVVGAFTVKHEAKTWLKNCLPSRVAAWSVTIVRDGDPDDKRDVIKAKEFMES